MIEEARRLWMDDKRCFVRPTPTFDHHYECHIICYVMYAYDVYIFYSTKLGIFGELICLISIRNSIYNISKGVLLLENGDYTSGRESVHPRVYNSATLQGFGRHRSDLRKSGGLAS